MTFQSSIIVPRPLPMRPWTVSMANPPPKSSTLRFRLASLCCEIQQVCARTKHEFFRGRKSTSRIARTLTPQVSGGSIARAANYFKVLVYFGQRAEVRHWSSFLDAQAPLALAFNQAVIIVIPLFRTPKLILFQFREVRQSNLMPQNRHETKIAPPIDYDFRSPTSPRCRHPATTPYT